MAASTKSVFCWQDRKAMAIGQAISDDHNKNDQLGFNICPATLYIMYLSFPGSSVGKERACSAGDLGLIPGSGRSPGEGNGKPLQYPCLENPMNREAWWAAVHGIAKSWA